MAVAPSMMELAALRRIVESHLRVYDAREEKLRGQVAAQMLFVMVPAVGFEARFDAARAAILAVQPESVVFLRRERGEDILFVAPRPREAPTRPGLRLGLFLATVATTVLAGSLAWAGFTGGFSGNVWADLVVPENLLWGGLSFALPLMAILGLHELAHYVTARRHGLRATLPLFLPMLPGMELPTGTLGAFISLKDPLPDRKALFDVGASGPIAGFLIAVPVVILGLLLTASSAHPIPDLHRPSILADGATILADGTGATLLTVTDAQPGFFLFNVTAPGEGPWAYRVTATLTVNNTEQSETLDATLAGGATERRNLELPEGTTAAELRITWDDGLLSFGDPLLVQWLGKAIPADGYLSHPTFFAGWVGLLVTGINLLPVGQLDGGHVARAVLGDRTKYAAYAAVGLLMVLSFLFNSWFLMTLFILFMGIHHPPPLNDRVPLDKRRLAVALVVLAIFIVSFVPVPVMG
ncbi:MAG: site-2 protease family protein [Candidatus Thermoplasmatota archaeon]|mgnify:CR=1 FL=1